MFQGKIYLPVIDNGMRLVRSMYTVCLAALTASTVFRNRGCSMESISYPYPDGALNKATASFLASDCRSMMIIDGDHCFTPWDVGMLYEHDEPFVGGIYAKKTVGLEWCLSPLPENRRVFDKTTDILCEVARVGRGFLRLDREVFERMRPHITDTYVDPDTQETLPLFWKLLPGGHSEDFEFCDKWRSIGGRVLVDRRVVVEHEGSATYPIKGTY